MHGFLSLAPVLALLLGQAEPSDAPAEQAAGAEPAAEPQAPPPAEPPPRRPKALRPAPAEGANPAASPAPAAAQARPAEADRAQVARAALAFLDALLAGDAVAVAAASSERFSFDGDVRTGKDEIRRTWRGLLEQRDAAQRGALLDLEVLPAADALARLGNPPPRLGPLAAAKGSWVAIANVSRRPVVLFLAREGGRWVVAGIE
jgi:ketosteroid isomerase-like protein